MSQEAEARASRSEWRDLLDTIITFGLWAMRWRRTQPMLVRRLQHREPAVRIVAIKALTGMGAIDPLVSALGHRCSFTRGVAAKGLRRLGWEPATPAERLGLAVAEWNEEVIVEVGRKTVELMLPLLGCADERIRRAALRAILEPRADELELVGLLRPLLDDPLDETRRIAMDVLARSHQPDAVGVVLQAATNDPSPRVRQWALDALPRLRYSEAHAPALARLLVGKYRYVAATALGRLGAVGVEAALGACPAEADPSLRICVAEVLARAGDPRGESALLSLLEDESCVDFKESIIDKLGQVPTLSSLEPLYAALDDPDPGVVATAASALAERRDPDALGRLQGVSGDHPDWLWDCLAEAIEEIETPTERTEDEADD